MKKKKMKNTFAVMRHRELPKPYAVEMDAIRSPMSMSSNDRVRNEVIKEQMLIQVIDKSSINQ